MEESQVEWRLDWVGPCECGRGGHSGSGEWRYVWWWGSWDSCNIVMIAGGCLGSVIVTVEGQATLTESSCIGRRTG